MADGGQAIMPADVVEVAARKLARALGHGYGWLAHVDQVAAESLAERGVARSEVYAIARRCRVEEQAARSIVGSVRVRQLHRWSVSRAAVAIPQHRPDMGVLAALSYAKLEGPLEPLLCLYATGDPRYWSKVAPYALACSQGAHGAVALQDAAQRLLFGRADVSQDRRAKELGLRASSLDCCRFRRHHPKLTGSAARTAWG